MKLSPMKPLYPDQTLVSTSTRYITIINLPSKPHKLKQPHNIGQIVEKTINNLESHSLSSSTTTSLSPSMSWRSNKLGKRWMEYQGVNNWEGLLDPLDNNLRAEILRFGQFVEAAYKSFEFDPSSPSYGSCKFPKTTLLEMCGFPNTGYKVTKLLHATSGIQLPRWMKKAPTWVSTQSSYIGYVAVCDDKEEIKRLGRRDIVIAYRGTATCLEWLENLRATLTHLPMPCKRWRHFERDKISNPMFQSGFLSLYTSACISENSMTSLQHMVRCEIGHMLQAYGHEPLSLTVTGHSLGAALAVLTVYDINAVFIRLPITTAVSFGGPRVGNRSFRQQLDRQAIKVLRIVNSDDVVTKVPGFVFHEDGHVEGSKRWIKKMIEKEEWLYDEVGEELRLCSRDSPYLSNIDVVTCHELNTYLHLVDGFVSSKRPFRATSKRFLP